MKKLIIPAVFALMGSAAFAQDACKVTVDGDDAMKFLSDKIVIKKADCPEFEVTVNHVGKLPKAAMGHNIVITKHADTDAVAKDGIAAGLDKEYVKPDDERVIAHTKVVGGGEKDSVTFKTDALEVGGDYDFFCSFPGHYAIMKGKVVVE